jgi:hypothetical protein
MGEMSKIGRNDPCPCGSGKKYKKCHGSAIVDAPESRTSATRREIRVRAFTDETGNSGNNLFDSGQPDFWTGTLVSSADIEAEGAAVHAECLRVTGHAELHGNALGLGGIENCAAILRDFFLKQNCRFFFTRIEKTHLAATKLFDVLMDSGINKAVTNLHYAVRGMRLPLAVQLIQIMDDNDRREFWKAYRTGSAAEFRVILTRLRDRLVAVHSEGLYNDRTVQLLRDGLDWGITYPEPLIAERQGELDSPNIVAFSLLMSMFHVLHEQAGAKVESFVHDEQNQFGKFLRESYKVFKRLNFKSTITATMLDITELPTFDCEFVMRESKDSIGLQFADVGLWLIKRFRDSGGEIRGNCLNLAEAIISTGIISNFSLRDMQEGVTEMCRQMEEKPWPAEPERMEFARKTIREMEEARQRRMKEPPDAY